MSEETTNEKVMCPLLHREIRRAYECEDIQVCAEGMQPEYFALAEAVNIPDYADICLECRHHLQD
jgi:hypothetical protein